MTAVVSVLGEALLLVLLGGFVGGLALFVEAVVEHRPRRAVNSLAVSVVSVIAFIALVLMAMAMAI